MFLPCRHARNEGECVLGFIPPPPKSLPVWDREPPLELRSCDPKLANGANGGYVSFTLERRHVENGRLESAVWSTICFPAYASRHIKCSKAFFHSRMRRRTDTLLNVLNQAKPEKKDREKKTASGRTFVRQV